MAATNIFYRLPSQRGTRIASIAGTGCTLDQFCKHIVDIEGLDLHDFIIASGTKVFRPSSCSLQTINLQNNSHVDILIPLLGGKGGFGSLLRAIGAQIEKTTNRDACRDLSGRRLRDIKREDELRKLIELKAKLEEDKRLRRKEKLEKLKKQSEKSKTRTSIQELVSMFDDHEFNKRRLGLGEILDLAVEKGLINTKKRQIEEVEDEKQNETIKKTRLHEFPEEDTIHNASRTEAEISSIDIPSTHSTKQDISKKPTLKTKPIKNYLWLGLEEEEYEEISNENLVEGQQ